MVVSSAGNGRMLTVRDVAHQLQVGLSSAHRLCNEEGFPVLRIGGVIRVPEAELDTWLREQHLAADTDLQAGKGTEGGSR